MNPADILAPNPALEVPIFVDNNAVVICIAGNFVLGFAGAKEPQDT